MQRLVAAYRSIVGLLERSAWLPLLLARVSVGLEFFLSGKGKLANLDWFAGELARIGIPMPEINAPFVATTEFTCGALVVLGLGTRLAAIPLIVLMLVAITTAFLPKLAEPYLANFFYLSEWAFVVILVWLVFAGGGKASVDHVLASGRARS